MTNTIIDIGGIAIAVGGALMAFNAVVIDSATQLMGGLGFVAPGAVIWFFLEVGDL